MAEPAKFSSSEIKLIYSICGRGGITAGVTVQTMLTHLVVIAGLGVTPPWPRFAGFL